MNTHTHTHAQGMCTKRSLIKSDYDNMLCECKIVNVKVCKWLNKLCRLSFNEVRKVYNFIILVFENCFAWLLIHSPLSQFNFQSDAWVKGDGNENWPETKPSLSVL